MLPFFITIDTEGDCLWSCPQNISTENVLWIPRFQELCEKYGLIPIWLTNYEIASDDRFVDYMRPKVKAGLCEIGIHVHAGNNPPLYTLTNSDLNYSPYLIEYPYEIMKNKFLILKNLLEKKFDINILSHRAGRWALNNDYIRLLQEMGIKYDCSMTPGIDWSLCRGISEGSQGSNYSAITYSRQILGDKENGVIVEYPVSIIPCNKVLWPQPFSAHNLLKSFYKFYKKRPIWLRPNLDGNFHEMKAVLSYAASKQLYAEFMIHSSELMPGGAQKSYNVSQVGDLYRSIEKIFAYAREKGFGGFTFDTWEKYNNTI